MTTKQTPTTVHVTMGRDLKKKLDLMAAADRRKFVDFVRILIEDEWERRNPSAAEGNGASHDSHVQR